MGNHELMNLQTDYRYTTLSDLSQYGSYDKRKEEFSIDNRYGKLLRTQMDIVQIIDNILFVHAG